MFLSHRRCQEKKMSIHLKMRKLPTLNESHRRKWNSFWCRWTGSIHSGKHTFRGFFSAELFVWSFLCGAYWVELFELHKWIPDGTEKHQPLFPWWCSRWGRIQKETTKPTLSPDTSGCLSLLRSMCHKRKDRWTLRFRRRESSLSGSSFHTNFNGTTTC